jgi:hypothetical protein
MGESEQQKDGGTSGLKQISSIQLDDGTNDRRAASGEAFDVKEWPSGFTGRLEALELRIVRKKRVAVRLQGRLRQRVVVRLHGQT